MKAAVSIFTLVAALSVRANVLPIAEKGIRDVDLPQVPAGCMTSHKGIRWGWLPDDGSNGAVNMNVLNKDTKKKACFFGDYSHISSTSYDGSDFTGYVNLTSSLHYCDSSKFIFSLILLTQLVNHRIKLLLIMELCQQN
jgi:hypothetical protein